MQSSIFAHHRMPVVNYDVTAELDNHGIPVLSFRSPGNALYRLHMDGASQLRNGLEQAGEHQNAAEILQLIDEAHHLRRG
jgi:hypothetical protein